MRWVLLSDALPFGRLWYGLAKDAVGYAKFYSRSHAMIVRVFDESGGLIETHESQGAFREVAVFGIPDPKWGEIVKTVVVLKPGKTLTADELIAYCRRSLANFKVPRSIEFSETELPKSGSGKILKRLLRDELPGRVQRLARKNFELFKANPRHPSLGVQKKGARLPG